ncbi:MAG: TonB family protein, partial [Bacteroidota bacterium]
MNGTVNFLLESGISLSLLATVYVVFLRKETFFKLNRLFLLGSLLFSVLLPLIRFRIYDPQPVMLSEITVTPYRNALEAVTIYGQDLSVSVEHAVLSTTLLIWIYITGLVFFIGRYLFRVMQVVRIIRNNKVQKYNGIKLVVLEKECSPYSFLNYVFISRPLQNTEGYDRMMAHEMEHIKQGHTFDVLMLELLTAFQWFNPFIWMLRRAVRENHEFLADQAVLDSGVSRGYYKKLLLNQFAGGQLVIANNFNYSLIKKRIKMMSKIKSSKSAAVKMIMGLLTAAALLVVFACEQKEMEDVKPDVQSEILSISFVDESKLMVKGDENDLERLNNMMSDSREFDVETDSQGNLILVKKAVPKTLDEEEQVFFVVEEMPEFPGGELALRRHVANNIKYPETAQKNGIQGRVYVSFVVDKEGNVANARIARGVDPSLDKEALRVINSLPAWEPGIQKG